MIDRLIDKIAEKQNPSVVGLDPTISMIPGTLKEQMLDLYGKTPKAAAQMFLSFNRAIIDKVADIVPAVKPQIAMYEAYGLDGLDAYLRTIAYAREKGMIVIGDIKRGDIASTAAAYAGHIGGIYIEDEYFDLWQEDAVTLNPYMGFDGVEPFIKHCSEKDRGLFILVRTSNPSSAELQDVTVCVGEAEGAGSMTQGMPLYKKTAALVDQWGRLAMGEKGYSRIGAVVGATFKEQGDALRKIMPHTFFLAPGYGAQGASAEDLSGYFDRNGIGCIVNSSRGITAAWQKANDWIADEFAEAARQAALRMRDDLRRVM